MGRDGRQKRGEATRAGILAVARRLFSEFGYHNTGIADIQTASGLTKGAFYHHFRTKQELALGVLELVQGDYQQCLFGPALLQTTPGRRLAALLDGAVALNERPEWRNCRLMATLSAEVTAADGLLADAVRAMQVEFAAILARLIAEAQQTEEAAPGDPTVWAQWVMSTLTGLLVARKLGVPHANPAAVVTQLKLVLLADRVREPASTDPAEEPSGQGPRVVRPPDDSEYF